MSNYIDDVVAGKYDDLTGYSSPPQMSTTPEPTPSAWRRVPDVGVAGLKSAVGLVETGLGLADIPTFGAVGRGLEKIGVRPGEAQKELSSWYSPQQQAAQAEVSGAFKEGFLPGVASAIRHPSTVATTVGESAASMLGGAGVARGILKFAPKVAPWAAGALGEGVVGAGSAAEQLREQSDTGYLSPKQVASSLGSGVGTAALGALGGKLAQRWGVGDVETALARGSLTTSAGKTARELAGKPPKGFIRRVTEAGITEGIFEELPQSLQEQMWQNFATNRPITEGLAEAGGMGMLAGVGMGATVGALSRRKDLTKPVAQQEQKTPPGALTPKEEVGPFQPGTMTDMFSGQTREASDPYAAAMADALDEDTWRVKRQNATNDMSTRQLGAPVELKPASEEVVSKSQFASEGASLSRELGKLHSMMEVEGVKLPSWSHVPKYSTMKKLYAKRAEENGMPPLTEDVMRKGHLQVLRDTANNLANFYADAMAPGIAENNRLAHTRDAEARVRNLRRAETTPGSIQDIFSPEEFRQPAPPQEIAVPNTLTEGVLASAGVKTKASRRSLANLYATGKFDAAIADVNQHLSGDLSKKARANAEALLPIIEAARTRSEAVAEPELTDFAGREYAKQGKLMTAAGRAKTPKELGYAPAQQQQQQGEENAIPVGGTAQEVPPVAQGEEVVAQSGEGVGQGEQGAEVARPSETENQGEINAHQATETVASEAQQQETPDEVALPKVRQKPLHKLTKAELLSRRAALVNELETLVATAGPKMKKAAEQFLDLARTETDVDTREDLIADIKHIEGAIPKIKNRLAYSETGEVENPHTKTTLELALAGMFFSPIRMRQVVTVYATQEEAVASGALSEGKGRIGGWQSGGNVGLIAENIEQGQELGVFLHEVGVHLGMEKLVGKANMEWLKSRVIQWAAKNDGSVESVAANWAVDMADASTSTDTDEELIAYMVQALVNAKINPQAAGTSNAHTWFRKLWAGAKAALRHLGFKRDFSGQNLVDLAYGAAHLELSGDTKSEAEVSTAVKFSEVASPTVDPKSPAAKVWGGFGDAFGRFLSDRANSLKEHGYGWLSLDHLEEVAKNINPKISEYVAAVHNLQAYAKDQIEKAAKVDRKWADVEDAEALSEVMRAARREAYDPSLFPPVNPKQVAVHKLYAALLPGTKTVYKEVRDNYTTASKERQEIMNSLLKATYKERMDAAQGDPKKLAELTDKKAEQLAALDEQYKSVKGPYFPFMRLGNWYAVGMSRELAGLMDKSDPSEAEKERIAELRKDAKHFRTSSFEKKSEAVREQKAMAGTYDVTKHNVAAESNVATRALSAAGLEDIAKHLSDTFDPKIAAELRGMMADLAYASLPEYHALKREIRSENIHGEEADMRRVFAISTMRSAHYMSRLKYASDIKSAMYRMKDAGSKNGPEAMQIYNEVALRAGMAMEYTDSPWMDKALTVSYLAHLGANPAFILTNASQVAMITVPWLAARSSTTRAVSATTTAYSEAVNIIKSSFNDQGWRFELEWAEKLGTGKTGANKEAMLKSLLDRNLLNITIEHDLNAVAAMKNRTLGDALRAGNLPVHVTELANRVVTALAAYDIAINDKKMNHEAATAFAIKAVSSTQLDYSALNAPRHMQRVLGSATLAKPIMQFRRYQQGMLWLVGKSIYDAAKGEDEETRQEARRTLYGLATTTGIMAGSLGLPLAGTAMWAATFAVSLFGDSDDPWDAETEYKNWLAELVGHDAAQAMVKGLPSWLFGVDVSKGLGMGDIASPMPFFRQGRTTKESAGSALVAAGGATVGTVIDTWEGIKLLTHGEWMKGSEKIIPLKGAKSLFRASRYATDGMTKPNGEVLLPPDEFHAGDIFVRGIGFPLAKETESYEGTAAVEGAKQATMDKRKRLLDEISTLRMAHEDTTDVDRAIREFNSRHPEKGVRIGGDTISKSVQARRANMRNRNEAGVNVGKANKAFAGQARFTEE